MKIEIGIGEYAVTNTKGAFLKTYALGSCVAVIVYDKVNKIAGMVHIAHPQSRINSEKAEKLPGYFADTGIQALLAAMNKAGANKKSSWIKIAGGARVLDNMTQFDIGKENILAVKKELWNKRLGIIKSDTGGGIHRTITIFVDTGEIIVKHNEREWSL